MQEFNYSQVAFSAGLHESQLNQTHGVLMNLSEDSLLKPFRLRANLPAPGCDLPGWYSDSISAGETFGQWISALSRYYAITEDNDTLLKVDRLVDAFSRTLEPTGRIFGPPPKVTENPLVTGGAAYIYDKLTCGLIDAHRFAHKREALDILSQTTNLALPHLPGRAVDQAQGGAHESYTIPENQFIAWERGAGPMHLELAKQYLHRDFFDSLARGQNVLPGRHAYSHVNALCSAAKAYLVLGDPALLKAAKNGYSFVAEQSFVTGGWGPNEAFIPNDGYAAYGRPPIRSLRESLTRTHTHFETGCGAYAQFKLTRYLLRTTQQSEFGDSMERVMYNTALGAKPLQADGRAFYYSDYNSDGRKVYFDGLGGQITSQWPCCSGTLPQLAADYRVSTYFHDSAGVYVNLYIPSTLSFERNGVAVALTQSGAYPLDDLVNLTLRTSRSAEFIVRLRIPAWTRNPSIHINGKRVEATIEPGTFFQIRRTWHSGDRIDLELPRQITLQSIDAQSSDLCAVIYGPIVLFAVANDPPHLTRQQILTARRQSRESNEWHIDTTAGAVRLVPFWELDNQRYSTYLSVT